VLNQFVRIEIKLIDCPYDSTDTRLDLAKASQLPSIITVDRQKLVDEKKLLKKNMNERRKLTSHYQRVQNHCFSYCY